MVRFISDTLNTSGQEGEEWEKMCLRAAGAQQRLRAKCFAGWTLQWGLGLAAWPQSSPCYLASGSTFCPPLSWECRYTRSLFPATSCEKDFSCSHPVTSPVNKLLHQSQGWQIKPVFSPRAMQLFLCWVTLVQIPVFYCCSVAKL